MPIDPTTTAGNNPGGNQTTQSVTDFLGQNGLPTDSNFRANLYQSLGLGSTNDYSNGAGTGESDSALMEALNKNPGLMTTLASALGAPKPTTPPETATVEQATPGQNAGVTAPISPLDVFTTPSGLKVDAQGNPIPQTGAAGPSGTVGTGPEGLTLPSDVAGINSFAQQMLQRYNASLGKAGDIAAGVSTQAMSPTDILNEVKNIRNATGSTDLQSKLNDLTSAKDNIEQDVRREAAASGGMVTESQIQDEVASRTKLLTPQIDIITKQLATADSIASLVEQESQTNRQQAQQRAQALITYYEGDADKAWQAAQSFYNTSQSNAKEILQQNLSINQKKMDIALQYGVPLDNISSMSLQDVYQAAIPNAKSLLGLKMLSQQLAAEKAQNSVDLLQGLLSPYQSNVVQSKLHDDGSGNKYLSLGDFPNQQDQAMAAAFSIQNGIPVLQKDQAGKLDAIKASSENLDKIQSVVEKFQPPTTNPVTRFLFGAKNTFADALETNPDIGGYNAWRTSVINNVQALAGGQGSGLRITNAEISTALNNDLPLKTDNLPTALAKLNTLRTQLDTWRNVILNPNSQTPANGGTDITASNGTSGMSNATPSGTIQGTGKYQGMVFTRLQSGQLQRIK